MHHRNLAGVVLALAVTAGLVGSATAADPVVAERFRALTRSSTWQLVETVPLSFPTHHPQGMVKIGDRYLLSSVEITERTEKFSEPRDGYDRSPGRGRGHLFEFDATGRLLSSTTLGEGDVYHPGGIDYDGRSVWVPVAEYRPNSHAIVYRIDPADLSAKEVFRFADHIGGIVHDPGSATLNGVSWGSRRFYTWSIDSALAVRDADAPPEKLRRLNPAHYVDYQDCHSAGSGLMLCGGLTEYRMTKDGPAFPLGGLELVDLASGRAVHQVPVTLWSDKGKVMTQNPFWVEPHGEGLRFSFVPEDDTSRMFVYDVMP